MGDRMAGWLKTPEKSEGKNKMKSNFPKFHQEIRPITINFTEEQYEWMKRDATRCRFTLKQYIPATIHAASWWQFEFHGNLIMMARYTGAARRVLADNRESRLKQYRPEQGLPQTKGGKTNKSVTIRLTEDQHKWLEASAREQYEYLVLCEEGLRTAAHIYQHEWLTKLAASKNEKIKIPPYIRFLTRMATSLDHWGYGL